MKRLKVLVACEESQIVMSAFRSLGHLAYSCDLVSSSGPYPFHHFKCDALRMLRYNWDLVIAHPPCTYLTKASACRLFPGGRLNESRYKLGLAARDFFYSFLNCSCSHVCVENPTPLSIFSLPPPSQVVQPYEFGYPAAKRTCLWLRGLPPLFCTHLCISHVPYIRQRHDPDSVFCSRCSARSRSRFFPGIAAAMACQWSDYLLSL